MNDYEKYYDYINTLAFASLLKYENKNSVMIDKLITFIRRTICPFEDNVDDIFTKEELDRLKKFVQTYSNYFELKGNIIKLKDNINYYDINDLAYNIKQKNSIEDDIYTIGNDMGLLSILGISTLRDMLVHYLSYEVELEECYYMLYTKNDCPELRDNINKLLRKRTALLMQIHLLNEYNVEAVMNVATDLAEGEVVDYEAFPINMDLYMNSEYYDEEFDVLEDNLYNIYQYAMFGKKKDEQTLAYVKLSEDISNIYYHNKFQDKQHLPKLDIAIENNAQRDYQEDRLFYLLYLKKLREYMTNYGYNKELMSSYQRLLYVMDSYGDKLYIDGNIAKALDNAPIVVINDDSFIGVHDEIYFIADEVFTEKKKNNNTITKLLMISTYYEITKDDNIIDIVNRHRRNTHYDDYYDIIFGSNKGKNYTLHK